MEPVLLVGLGGALGSVLRFECSKLQPVRGIPAGTALVNILGSSACSLLIFLPAAGDLSLFLGIGLLGGFTTFSTFCFETFRMLEDRDYYTGITNILINIAGSLAGVGLGYLLIQGMV
ncbi:MAG: chromosome condensation protein CrcB [Methanomicrobiales archaeon]|nr:chromosome condensation protein CrcB [Methanomicrobiales archaeon]